MNTSAIGQFSKELSITFPDLHRECHNHMAQNNLDPQNSIITVDNKFHRYSIDAKKNKRDEWYIAWEGFPEEGKPYLICIYGSWSFGSKYEFKSWENGESKSLFNEEERKDLHANYIQRKKEAEELLKEENKKAAGVAKEIWDKSSQKPNNKGHLRYIKTKGIQPIGVRFGKNPSGYDSIIIPLRNIEGNIRSLQFISVSDDEKVYKTFLSGGEKKGNFGVIGDPNTSTHFFITEGYATAASIYEATGEPVVIAFDSGNIEPVTRIQKKQYPNHQITIAADDDKDTEEKNGINPGQIAAEEAAKKNRCEIVSPKFEEDFRLLDGKRPTDFNDLHVQLGSQEVKRQLERKIVRKIDRKIDMAKSLGESILQGNKAVESFSVEHLPLAFRELSKEASKFSDADPIIAMVTLIVAVSGFFKTSHYLPHGEYFQDLYPNIWALQILESGGFKSTGQNLGNSIARDKHGLIMEEIANEERRLTEDNKISDGKKRDEMFQDIQKKDVILPSLSTPQGLLEDLARGLGGSIFHHEFSVWLSNMEKQYNEGLKSLFTTLYDVPDIFDTKTKGGGTLRIRSPFISICGISTVDWVKKQIKPSDVESGFFARFLLFCPVTNEKTPDALPKSTDTSSLLEKEMNIKNILNEMSFQKRRYKLSKDAKNMFHELHDGLYDQNKSLDERARSIIGPYLKRWSPYLLKIAMIFQPFFEKEKGHLRTSDHIIEPNALEAASSIVGHAIKSTVYLFDHKLGASPHQDKCRILLEYIAKRDGKVLRKKITASRILEGGAKDYDYVLQTLHETGKLRTIKAGETKNDEYILIDG